MENRISLKIYKEVLQELESNTQPNHLLLGNGFNGSLGVETSYKNIFEKMKERYLGYSKVENILKENGYDIESLISELNNTLKEDEFLPQYIERNIKLDFMKAASSIVREKIKGVYLKRNQSIHLLLKNFTNYFTLNYDPFLYLLLMKFKKDDEPQSYALAIQIPLHFQQEALNQMQDNIYKEIKKARENGYLEITIEESPERKNLSQCKKTEFTNAVQTYFADKGWRREDIKKAINLLWKEESQHRELEVKDGFSYDIFDTKKLAEQNLFFLHGAFHIYRDKKSIKKITEKHEKALYEKLDEIIGSEEKDIVCVFAGTSNEKKKHIQEDEYLRRCFEKLMLLNGSLVILGSSLDNNDKHIFEAINQSSISSIYISCYEKKKTEYSMKAKDIFPNKKITLFDYTTISYGNA